jgi:hypothetical protein
LKGYLSEKIYQSHVVIESLVQYDQAHKLAFEADIGYLNLIGPPQGNIDRLMAQVLVVRNIVE